MVPFSRSSIQSPTFTYKLPTFFSPFCNQICSISQTLTSKMKSQPSSKRPTCPNCSKPLSFCLCTKIQTPIIDNKVHITILQHNLEKKHPLNSAKIAKLGLRNVDLVTVSDVFFDTQIAIRSLGSGLSGGECTPGVCENVSESLNSVDVVNEVDLITGSSSERFSECPQKGIIDSSDFVVNCGALVEEEEDDTVLEARLDDQKCDIEPVINLTVGKYGEIKSVYHPWKLRDEGKTLNYEHLIASPEAARFLERGYVVKRLQNQQKEGSIELQQVEEFEIEVPPGTVLLFPAQDSVPVEAIDFEVKNLIVLDGTWAKANRMYKENPWLWVLPCVKLDIEKLSVFSEVRRQPKPGCLSTIESIVYALKGLGEKDNLEGLFNLLDVLESMVEDQRRCKDERVRKLSST